MSLYDHAKDGCKPTKRSCMPGAGLSESEEGKAPFEMPALKPYWGKPTVRNFRGDGGNGGIIRSPLSVSILLHHFRESIQETPDREPPSTRGGDLGWTNTKV